MNFLKNFMKNYHVKDYNFALVISVSILSLIGVLAVGSALPSAQTKQIVGMILGLIVMAIVSLIDYEWILNLHWFIYGINLFFLLYGFGFWLYYLIPFRVMNIQ